MYTFEAWYSLDVGGLMLTEASLLLAGRQFSPPDQKNLVGTGEKHRDTRMQPGRGCDGSTYTVCVH